MAQVPWLFPQSLYKTAIEFLKLEKIELGGVRGNILGRAVTQIYDEVFELVKVFAECKYDPLDPGDPVSGCWAGSQAAAPEAEEGTLTMGRTLEGPHSFFWGGHI